MLRLDGNELTNVWSEFPGTIASTVDMTMVNIEGVLDTCILCFQRLKISFDIIFFQIDGEWYMAVANCKQLVDSTDPFSAPSKIYKWRSTTETVIVIGYFRLIIRRR